MEKEIRIKAGESLESAVELLLAAKARGEHVYCDFNGHLLHSDTITMDDAYLELTGLTKAKFDASNNSDGYEEELKARKFREKGYAKKVAAHKSNVKKPITSQIVVNGLKYIAEHQSSSQEELIDGLLKLGCDFSLKDVKKQFPEITKLPVTEGMKQGNIGCGAAIITQIRDNEMNRSHFESVLLSSDDNTSIYNFIRVVTGDKTYTKQMVDLSSINNKKHR